MSSGRFACTVTPFIRQVRDRDDCPKVEGRASIRERRRTLRYRNLLVRQMVQMKIKISALLMEAGVSYSLFAATRSRSQEAAIPAS